MRGPQIDQIARAARLGVRRGTVRLAAYTAVRTLLQIDGRAGEVRQNVELLLPYGMSAVPDAGDVIFFQIAGAPDHLIALGADNAALRIAGLAKGELGLKNLAGVTVYLSAGGLVIDGAGMNIMVKNAPQVVVEGGDVLASGISLLNHVHGGVTTGAGDTGAPAAGS